MIDPADGLAARVTKGGDPEEVHFEEDGVRFLISGKGDYRIDGDAFTFIDRHTGRVTTILGYPTGRLAELGAGASR